MNKFLKATSLFLMVLTLASCSGMMNKKAEYSNLWEREKLSADTSLTGSKAKDLLDRDLAECISISKNRQNLEMETLNTKRCAVKDGDDWKAQNSKTFIEKCMKRKGWIPSRCCAYKKSCSCN